MAAAMMLLWGLILLLPSHCLSQFNNRQFDNCGYMKRILVLGEEGEILSPNYPDNYSANTFCSWTLIAPSFANIELSCDSLELEDCPADNSTDDGDCLTVEKNPGNENNTEAVRFCGSLPDGARLISSGFRLELNFQSNAILEKSGFKCRWMVMDARNKSHLLVPSDIEPLSINNGDCGTSNAATANRVYGGHEASKFELPWIAALVMDNKWFCGGTLISSQWVLTAGHCITTYSDTTAKYIHVFLGKHVLFANEPDQLTISNNWEFYKHPQFKFVDNKSGKDLINDIALIKLKTKVDFAIHTHIRPICLPLGSDHDDKIGASVTAAGWGLTSKDSPLSPVLKTVDQRLSENNICTATYGNRFRKNNLCAESVVTGDGTCTGDSGGPLQYYDPNKHTFVLLGVVSFNSNLGCESGKPNCYSKVHEHLDFIADVTKMVLK